MPNSNGVQAAAVVAAVSFLFIFTTETSAQTTDEANCRAGVAKNVRKYVNKVAKTVEKCHKLRAKSSSAVGIDCNDIAQADTKSKLPKSRSKVQAGIAAKCASAPTALSAYSRCPSPANQSDDGGATDGIDSFDELSQCMVDLVDAVVGSASAQAIGLKATKPTSTEGKCIGSIAKGLRKAMTTIAKVRTKCQRDLDRQASGLTYGCSGVGAEPSGKIDKALTSLRNAIASDCSFPDPNPLSSPNERIDAFGSCGDTVSQLQSCIVDRVAARVGGGLIGMAYELRPVCSAGTVVRTITAGTGDSLSATELNIGWAGPSHGADVPDNTGDFIAVDCDEDCANCQVALDTSKDRPNPSCRCARDARIACEVVNGPDPTNCSGGIGGNNACTCYFGAPLPLSSGNTPACVLNTVRQDYTGTADIGRGVWNDVVPLASVVYLGLSAVAPCPNCSGDVTPNDGVRDGTCTGLLSSGACDTNGESLTFGPTSHDCRPTEASNVSGGGLIIDVDFSTGESILPFTLPCETPAGQMCPCRVCSGNSSMGCASDAECAAAGTGTCTAGGGAGVQKNGCDGFACNPDGRCTTGPNVTYCDGITRANGTGLITCATDGDCNSAGAGSCTLVEGLRCFPDPIVVEGETNPHGHTGASIFCIPPTASIAIDSAAGLPGAGTFVSVFETDVRCAQDRSISFEPPAGLNCPPIFPPASTTTTTLLPPVPCASLAAGTCALGTDCPGGTSCQTDALTCSCQPVVTTTTLPPVIQCADLTGPICTLGEASCPGGTTCQGTLLQPCACLP